MDARSEGDSYDRSEGDSYDWNEGDSYERYMGRWSRFVGGAFLAWLAVPPGADWIDVGCGTGALTTTIAEVSRPRRLCGVDPSSEFIAAARRRLGEGPDLRVGDAQALPFDSDEFDVAVSGLALNFIPDPDTGVGEMCRVTKGGGIVAAYVWDYADGMQMIRKFWDAAVELDPSVGPLDEAARFPLCDPERLTELFRQANLANVETFSLEIPTVFHGFDDYWRPFLGGQGPAPGYVGSLPAVERKRLERRLRAELPPSPEGLIDLTARAWSVKGTV